MNDNQEADRPDATTTFGTIRENETDERPGMAAAAAATTDAAGDAARNAVLPPRTSDQIDTTPLRARFSDGGQ